MTFTPDNDFDAFTHGDITLEVTGFVDQVYASKQVGPNKTLLFKFVLNNGGTKRVLVCIWGKELIDQYESRIVTNQILNINGAQCRAQPSTYQRTAEGLVPFELFIQSYTEVNFEGTHQIVVTPPSTIIDVEFDDIAMVSEGTVRISGYVKTFFRKTFSRNESMSYGCGAITDGIYKITVQISNFLELNIEKGTFVTVTGTVNNKEGSPLIIQCKSIDGVVADNNHPKMTAAEMRTGVRIPKRVRLEDGI